CMLELKQRGLIEPVLKAAREKPFFGICMGMQVLLAHSKENEGVDCMGLYEGEVCFFGAAFTENKIDAKEALLKIPHMGWNRVHQTQTHPLWNGVEQDSRFYFVHSYYVSRRKINPLLPVKPNSALISSRLLRGITFLQHNSTQKKVRQMVCSC
ncbi:MAG: hypothetical protein ABUK13_10490, partial [Gammaproteobacteria bacterium]